MYQINTNKYINLEKGYFIINIVYIINISMSPRSYEKQTTHSK
ncbi:hypothetical protein MtrunA17_Chr8g0373971 [Medicago truncatula]|uniref:Uncharacterized protein n=1 Tax=Medicago truncatula TaxID=3880 RepID=A0A396GPU6_MEDTR|nr:hypothetical protein MtrunA17_Chr8g0373971 [Medicago truncatula]